MVVKKNVVLASVLALMLVLTACGGNSGGGSADNDAGSAGSGNEMAVDNTLDIQGQNFNFGQDTFKVKAGEPITINFKSTEGMHGLAIDEFDINISGEGTATFTPEEPGEYTIYCSIPCGNGHKDMKSTLIVE
jgi:cytochrome c oxidase subunit 2